MDFRTLQTSVSLLLFLVLLNIVTDKRITATSIREKCQCVKETDTVAWRKTKNYTIIEKDPLCNKVQIILQLSDKQSCLNPDSKPGKILQKCWKRIKLNKKNDCLKILRKKRNKKIKKQ